MLSISALLLLYFLVPSDGRDSIGLPNRMKFHKADLFQLKCDSLLYRSFVMDDLCYFAINEAISYDDGQAYCEHIFAGATVQTDRNAAGVLLLMDLKKDDYHSITTRSSKKGVLCKYVNPFTCKDSERNDMRGRCVTRHDVKLNFTQASKYCTERGSHLPWINNEEENSAVANAVALSSSDKSKDAIVNLPYWIDQTSAGSKWSAATSQPVQYWQWLTGANILPNCAVSIAVAVNTKVPIGGCVAYAKWHTAPQTQLQQVVCVRSTDSDFNPAPPIPPTPPPTTLAPFEKNSPPRPEWTWMLSYYYNYGRILHGYCADPVGCNQMFNNGIGYDRSSGSGNVGRTITREGMKRMPEVCSENWDKLKPLSFRLNGVGYLFNFDNQGIFVGYVAVAKDICGVKYGIWPYSCAFSPDVMYAQDLEWNTFYKGRWWGNVPTFWLWP